MTPHRSLNIAAAVLLAVAIAAALSTSHLLDGPTDHSAEWQQADTLADAQRAAREARRAELDAIRQCTATHGPGVVVGYTIDGDIVCKARRGGGPVTVASSKGGGL